MQSRSRRLIFALAFALGIGAGALAQTNTVPDDPPGGKPPAGAPPGFTAPADPKPDETNAQRAKSQPGNNAPFWRDVRESGNTPGFTTLPDHEGATLIQRFTQYPGSAFTTAGEAWREVRNRWIVPGGAALIVFALLVLALFCKWRGPIRGDHLDRPKPIERFTYFERATHWTVAITFVVLAVSGIVMAFRQVLRAAIVGATLFGWLTYALKTLHNVVGPVFALALLVFIVGFVRDASRARTISLGSPRAAAC
jgi:formate dehydrogenase subunit gamma